jgi:hypothetical protein
LPDVRLTHPLHRPGEGVSDMPCVAAVGRSGIRAGEMTVAALLDRLDNVRKTGPGRWLACCPCHESKSRSSLAIREESDGRVLMHDFGGCAVTDILWKLGLDFDALYRAERVRGPHDASHVGEVASDTAWSAVDVLRAVHEDVLAAAIVTSDICTEKMKLDVARDKLWVIAQRLAAAAAAVNPIKRDTHGKRRSATVG